MIYGFCHILTSKTNICFSTKAMDSFVNELPENIKMIKRQLPIKDFSKFLEFEKRIYNDPNMKLAVVRDTIFWFARFFCSTFMFLYDFRLKLPLKLVKDVMENPNTPCQLSCVQLLTWSFWRTSHIVLLQPKKALHLVSAFWMNMLLF